MNSRQLRANETGRSFPTEKTLCSMCKCDAWANHHSPGKKEIPMKETCIKVTNRARAENPQALAWAFGLGSACAIRAPARQLKPVSLRTVPKVQALARLVIMAATCPATPCFALVNPTCFASQCHLVLLPAPNASLVPSSLKNQVYKATSNAPPQLQNGSLASPKQVAESFAASQTTSYPFSLPESSEKSQNTLGRCSARGPRWSC